MARVIVLDANVVDEINRGNNDVARALDGMLRAGDTVYISKEAYKEMITDSNLPRAAKANELFLKDTKIEIAPPGNTQQRLDVIGKNQPRDNFAVLGEKDVLVAAQAAANNAEVWSLDRAYRNNGPSVSRTLGVKVAAECQLSVVGNARPADYRVGRQLMKLPPVEINVNGYVTTRGSGGAGSGATTVAPDIKIEPSPRGQAIVGGITLVFQGLNIVLDLVNDAIQKQAAERALAQIQGDVATQRAAHPEYGVLLIFVSKATDAGDSLIRPGRQFQYLEYGMGTTQDEARRNIRNQGSIAPGLLRDQSFVTQEVWIPPMDPDAIAAAKTPFKAFARGRFWLGGDNKVKFQGVSFDWMQGFDDTMESTLPWSSDTPTPEFLILQSPTEVRWYNMNGSQIVRVPLISRSTANNNTISVVDLDTYSPFHASAVMVFPASDAAKRLFALTSPTADGNLLAHYSNFSLVRWVRPENIHLLSFL